MNERLQEFRNILDKECKGIISNKPNYEGFSPIDSTKTNLFWPCMLYQVEVKVDSVDLDIFERTVLKLSDCKITKIKELAENLCMESETVEFIQNRLVIKGLLNDRTFTITERGRGKLDKFAQKNSGEIKVVSLLRDLNTGLFLDYVEEHPAQNSFSGSFSKKEEPDLLWTRCNLPDEKTFVGNIVVPANLFDFNRLKSSEPEKFLILRAIRKFQRIAGKNSPVHLNDKSNSAEIKTRQLVLVHTKGFSNSSGDIFSTDAAGLGISDIFTEFIKKSDSDSFPWISSIYQKGNVETENKLEENLIEEKIRFEYPKISRVLYDSVCNLQKLQENVKSDSNLREEIKRVGEKIVYSAYTAFEYALQLHYADFNDTCKEDELIALADTEARKLNKEKISEMEGIDSGRLFYLLAQRLGFNVSSEDLSLLKVYQGKIDGMRKGDEPELTPLLCLTLAYANSDTGSPLAYLAQEDPDFIRNIFDLKSLRDKTLMAHGPGLRATDVSEKKLKDILQKIMEYSRFLNVKLGNDFETINKKTKNSFQINASNSQKILQKRYNQKTKLYDDFGYSVINRLPTNLVNQMINWKITLAERKFVAGSSCSLLQQFFESAVLSLLKYVSPPEKSERNADFASEKIKTAGFSLKAGRVSDSLRTVNYKRINKAVCGGGCDTLGAAIIAFLLLLSPEELRNVAKNNDKFILGLSNLLEERGHSDLNEYSAQQVSTYNKIATYIIKELIQYI